MRKAARWMIAAIGLAVLAGSMAAGAAAAPGDTGRLFWTDPYAQRFLFTELDGSTEQQVLPSDNAVTAYDMAYDPETGQFFVPILYRVATLDAYGTGEFHLLNTPPIYATAPESIAFDTEERKVYVGNADGSNVSRMDPDGSQGFGFSPVGASGTVPYLGIDPEKRRLYWRSGQGNELSTSLLATDAVAAPVGFPGTTVSSPKAMLVDRLTDRLYAASSGDSRIAWTEQDGSGAGDLDTTGLDTQGVSGMALDSVSRRLYWVTSDSVMWKSLDDSGSGRLIEADTAGEAGGMVIIRAPEAVDAPGIAGGDQVGTTLTCSEPEWRPDAPEARFFMAPSETSFAWYRDGDLIPGEVGGSLLASEDGAYTCRASGTNPGGTSQSGLSPIQEVEAPGPTGPTGPTSPTGPTGPTSPTGTTGPTGPTRPVCPPKLTPLVSASDFNPRRPFGRSKRVNGLRIKLRSDGRVNVRIEPSLRYRTRGGIATWRFKARTVRVNRSRELRFTLPRKATKRIRANRGRVKGAPVTFILKSKPAPGVDPGCALGTTQQLRTKVVGVSKRVGLRRL